MVRPFMSSAWDERLGAALFPFPLRYAFAAGDAEDLAGDEAAFLRRQEHIDRRQFDRLAGAAEGNVLAEGFDLFGELPTAGLQYGPEWTGCDRVDANALLDELLGQRLGIGDDAGLGGAAPGVG